MLFWVSSTIIQALAALGALLGMFYIYRLEAISNKIRDLRRKISIKMAMVPENEEEISSSVEDLADEEHLAYAEKDSAKSALYRTVFIISVVIVFSLLILPFGGKITPTSSLAKQIAESTYVHVFISVDILLAIYASTSVFTTLALYIKES